MGEFVAAAAEAPESYVWVDQGANESSAVAPEATPSPELLAPSPEPAASRDVSGTLVTLALVPVIALVQLAWVYGLYRLIRGATGA